MNLFTRGSEWRKWDLHVHAPGGTMEDRYVDKQKDEREILNRFCEIIHGSDVDVIGITDYFTLDNYIRVTRRYREIYGYDGKFFFPNLELRLVEVVSKKEANVNLHLLFDPSLPEERLQRFIRSLKTSQIGPGGTTVTCADLQTGHFDSATVYLDEVKRTLAENFGTNDSWRNSVFPVVPAGNDGIRPGGEASGTRRKKVLATNIDTFISGVFGNGGDVAYYQNERPGSNRREDLPPRPVFAGSDAHSFEDLESWLGRELRGSTHKNVTWVKADPTFEGLLQTAIEPTERVRIQATKPDRKQPYQVITSVCFQDEHNFPTTIDFNQNLVSIIGSRSSGKSSLLAHIAHAVDSTYTQRQQFDSGFYTSLSETGPAAGRTWGETPDDICQVKWGGSGEITGRVIYIPQNSLFNLNERSAEITSKIAPILFRADPAFEASHRQVAADVEAIGTEVREHVRKWFERTLEIGITTEKIVGVGDPQAIRRQKETLTAQLADQRAKLALAADDIAKYQALTESLSKLREEKSEAFDDLKELSPYLTPEPSQSEPKVAPRVSVTIATSPAPQTLPAPIQDVIANLVDEASEALRLAIGDVLVAQHKELVLKVSRVDAELDRLQTENAELISQSEANTVIDEIVKQLTQQDSALSLIEKYETELSISVESRDKCIQGLIEKLEQRSRLIDDHLSYFGSGPVAINGMQLGIEGGYDEEKLQLLSQDFDQRTNTDFVERNVGLQIEQVLAKPADFLTALSRGEQKLKQGRSIAAVAEQVLSVVPDFRFFAELEGDRIGGFGRSSMTPGKQAMFALQLILSESEDHWPLLIDQPEDDLDSRSIYDHVVPYLKKRKTERQVIMVTHNANLVVGADSEQVIVANRHAADSKNAGERTFDYLAGSLEHTRAYKERQHRLESCGIREHTCEILDGGTEAFQKRKDKYRV